MLKASTKKRNLLISSEEETIKKNEKKRGRLRTVHTPTNKRQTLPKHKEKHSENK